MLQLPFIWPAGTPSSLFLCSFDIPSSFFEHFLTFCYQWCSRFIMFFPSPVLTSVISSRSTVHLSIWNQDRSTPCSLLLGCYCSRSFPQIARNYTHIYMYIYLYRKTLAHPGTSNCNPMPAGFFHICDSLSNSDKPDSVVFTYLHNLLGCSQTSNITESPPSLQMDLP